MDDALTHLTAAELEEAGLLEEARRQSREDLRAAAIRHREAEEHYKATAIRDEELQRYRPPERSPQTMEGPTWETSSSA